MKEILFVSPFFNPWQVSLVSSQQDALKIKNMIPWITDFEI
jgi:hypothetical protein